MNLRHLTHVHPTSRDRVRGAALAAVIVVISVAPFVAVLPAYFVADDLAFVDACRSAPPPSAQWLWEAVSAMKEVPTTFYRPLPFMLLRIEYSLWGVSPAPYHALNLVLHGCNALLLYCLVVSLTGQRRGRLPAALVAILFAVHPRRVEPVAWISARPDLLCSLFALMAANLYLKAARTGRWWLAVAAAVVWWPGLLCKEACLLVPFALAAVPVREGAGPSRPLVRRLVWMMPFAASLVVHLLVRRAVLGVWFGGYGPSVLIPSFSTTTAKGALWHAALNVIPPLEFYRALLIAHHRTGLALEWGLLASVSLLFFAAVVWRRRSTGVPVAVLWVAAAIVPVAAFGSSLDSTLGDRMLYAPGIGVAIGLAELLRRASARTIGVCAVVGALLLGQTTSLVRRWRTAGELTYSLARDLANHAQEHSDRGPLYLLAVPHSYGGAYMFSGGVQPAARLAGSNVEQSLRLVTVSSYILTSRYELPVDVELESDRAVITGRTGVAVVWMNDARRDSLRLTSSSVSDVDADGRVSWKMRVAATLPPPGTCWLVAPNGVVPLGAVGDSGVGVDPARPGHAEQPTAAGPVD